MNFSQRQGIIPLQKSIQTGSMDDELRMSLWNMYTQVFLPHFYGQYVETEELKALSKRLWINFFKRDVDEAPLGYESLKRLLRLWFFNKNTLWNWIYDFMEMSGKIVTQIFPDKSKFGEYYRVVNVILEKESSGFRFLRGIIVPITNEHEKAEIETALNSTYPFNSLKGCNIHLTQALSHLSNKINPDYRNSIKESISAVESICKVILGNQRGKATLAGALKIIGPQISLHPALESGFNSLYGYTNDADGIRHGLMDVPNCDLDDARYMLVSSSAFINYLIIKAEKAGIFIQ